MKATMAMIEFAIKGVEAEIREKRNDLKSCDKREKFLLKKYAPYGVMREVDQLAYNQEMKRVQEVRKEIEKEIEELEEIGNDYKWSLMMGF